MFSALAAFCNTLAPFVVAEGIESEDDLHKLAASHVDWIQGEIAIAAGTLSLKIDLDQNFIDIHSDLKP
ncbi:MAG: unnamed protein product [uncultured Caballeronia sp.]|nr:MAG: unnamed protein product [uncultured Caballeronia sp.]